MTSNDDESRDKNGNSIAVVELRDRTGSSSSIHQEKKSPIVSFCQLDDTNNDDSSNTPNCRHDLLEPTIRSSSSSDASSLTKPAQPLVSKGIQPNQQQDEHKTTSLKVQEKSWYPDENRNKTTSNATWKHSILWVIIHLVVIAIYAIPMYTPSEYNNNNQNNKNNKNNNNAVLDELHIVSSANHDVNGHSNDSLWSVLQHIFTNDYWGRPMNSSSSHKSWRPLSVLLFRYIRGLSLLEMFDNNVSIKRSGLGTAVHEWVRSILKFWSSDLNVHRLVNVLSHATAAEFVGILATKLVVLGCGFQSTYRRNNESSSTKVDIMMIRYITKILWSLHPTHIEVTANAANRPHLVALLCSLLLSDPDTPWVLFIIVLVSGFLACETFLFQIVPATAMLIMIQYVRLFHHYNTKKQQNNDPKQRNEGNMIQEKSHRISTNYINKNNKSFFKQVVLDSILYSPNIIVRIILLLLASLTYYGGRYYYDTLSIPTGLIRPAENPFYQFEGYNRARNYLYVLSIHIAKQWDLDFIGFSHEYGYECIKAINDWSDTRLLIPLAQFAVHALVGLYLLWINQRNEQSILSLAMVLYIVHLSWSVTLLPLTGIIKIGTFIADRLTVASTVSVSIVWGTVISHWIGSSRTRNRRTQKFILLIVLLLLMWKRLYRRTREWMDSLPLLQSSLQTCPRFAKAHLELSKIYSGLYPEMFNLKQSRWHLEQVEKIDPKYCDVHQQFAHVAVQENKYIEFEERLTNALLCPFTLGGSLDIWKRYWNMALDTKINSQQQVTIAKKRYHKYQERINEAIAASSSDEDVAMTSNAKSPFVGWKKN